jgi:hypothetical protein
LKPEISVLHSLARSGATLVSKCIACMRGHVLLSEINPRWSYFDALTQAHEWFDLVSAAELAELRSGHTGYVQAIRLIHERCAARGEKLVIRDWSHVDFTPGPYPVRPVLQLSQCQALQAHFDIKHIALVRDPIDSYLSLIRLAEYRGRLDPLTYLKGVRVFAGLAAESGYVRYEDFCEDPAHSLKTICSALNLRFDEGYAERFGDYTDITGENYRPDQKRTLTGEPVGDRTSGHIRLPPHRDEYATLARRLAGHADYEFILKTLGYDRP